MIKILRTRLRQKHRTIAFPKKQPTLPERLRGFPVVDLAQCPDDCRRCSEICPTQAINIDSKHFQVDLGRCLFCTDCQSNCPKQAIRYQPEYRLAVRNRSDLRIDCGKSMKLAEALEIKFRRLLGRSLKLRQVSAGGCSACEADVNVLNTVVFDLGRFGIQFVASPRHADGLLITGPVTENMKLALQKTYAAVPSPKIVIAVGACAISGGPFMDHPEVHNGADSLLPIDLYVPGCPPHPVTILDGLLRLLGKL